MALAYRTPPAFTAPAGTTTLTVSKQAGTSPGDLIVLLFLVYGLSSAATLPDLACAGFLAGNASASSAFAGTGYGYLNGQVLWRTADGTEGATFSVSNPHNGAARCFLATVEAAVVDGAVSSATGTSSTPAAAPITLTGPGDWLLWSAWDLSSGSSYTITLPAGFTSQATGSTGEILGDKESGNAAGPTGPVAGSIASGAVPWVVNMIAVAPAPVLATPRAVPPWPVIRASSY